MRKYLCFVTAVVLLAALLAGCGGEVPAPTGPNTEPTEEPSTQTTAQSSGGIPMPENPGNALVEYDPDREAYILLENMELTSYGPKYGFSITVMSRRVLDPVQIQVQIPCGNDYSYEVNMSELNYRNTEYEHGTNNSYLPFYVYQNYLGVDFSLAGKLYGWYTDPPAAGSQEAAEMEAVTGGQDLWTMYEGLINTGAEDFAALKPEDTREFYIYDITVGFDVAAEETITELDVVIGEETYHKELGSLRLVPEAYPTMYPVREEYPWSGVGIAFGGGGSTLYGSGVHETFLFEGTAAEDMVLEGFHLAEESFEVLELLCMVTSNGVTMEMGWDGASPIALYAGDQVSLSAVVRHEKVGEFQFLLGLNYELVYSIGGEKFSQYSTMFIESDVNLHEVYAIVFDGLDMEPYYKEFYRRNEYN